MPVRATRDVSERINESQLSQPVLLESDPVRLARLQGGLRKAGVDVLAVTHIADIERWPSETFVITDIGRFSSWWRKVGANCVIVLANTRKQGVEACQHGATAWLPRNCAVSKLVQAVKTLCLSQNESPSPPAEVVRGAFQTRRVRIIRPVAGVVDGVSLSALWPGLIYELEVGLARYLVTCGAAEESATRPVSVVPADDPYIAHLTGGVIVTYAPQPKDIAADKTSTVPRLRKRKDEDPST